MVGDLQAIAGKAMPEIPSLDMPLLESSAELERKAGWSDDTPKHGASGALEKRDWVHHQLEELFLESRIGRKSGAGREPISAVIISAMIAVIGIGADFIIFGRTGGRSSASAWSPASARPAAVLT
jgi:hypothetical protein